MFWVHGGVHTNMNFWQVVEGTQEVYGPFETRQQAVDVWRGRMGLQIDTCEHRLFIEEADSLSACGKCGAIYRSAAAGNIHKCGKCSGGFCSPIKQ